MKESKLTRMKDKIINQNGKEEYFNKIIKY